MVTAKRIGPVRSGRLRFLRKRTVIPGSLFLIIPEPGDRVVPLSAQMIGMRFTAASRAGSPCTRDVSVVEISASTIHQVLFPRRDLRSALQGREQ